MLTPVLRGAIAVHAFEYWLRCRTLKTCTSQLQGFQEMFDPAPKNV